MFIRYPRGVMHNKENNYQEYYQEYTVYAKYQTASNFFMQMFNVSTLCMQYQMASVKALIQVDFPVRALSEP